MKPKITLRQNLKSLIAIHTLRQDALFIVRLLNFSQQKQFRNSMLKRLATIENQRKDFETKIIEKCTNCNIDIASKTALFCFNAKIAKISKLFHNKLYNFSPKIADMTDVSSFLADFRQFSIQCFAQIKSAKQILICLLQKLQERYQKEVQKIYYQSYKEEYVKNHRYLQILKLGLIQSCVRYFEKSLQNLEKGKDSCFQNCFNNDQYEQFQSTRPESFQGHTGELLNLHQDSFKGRLMQRIERIRQQGFCDYSISRIAKLSKELKSRNNYNEKTIQKYRKCHKNKMALRKTCTQGYTIQVKKEEGETEISPKPRKSTFRITPSGKNTARHNSSLIRPSTQSRNISQNKIPSLKQTLMEINIDQKLFSAKINRTKKRIPLIAIKGNADKLFYDLLY